MVIVGCVCVLVLGLGNKKLLFMFVLLLIQETGLKQKIILV